MKICSQCLEEKPRSDFYANNTKDRKDKTRSECKTCTNAKARAKQAERTAYMRRYRRRSRGSTT